MRHAALAALLLIPACTTTDTPEPHHSAFSDTPKYNVPRSQDTPESYVLPPPRRPRASRSGVRTQFTRDHVAGACTLEVIRRRESGGNYGAVSASGKYRGAYQFDASTWRSVGGTGDPAAASPEEQDARAAELMRRRGTQPWSVCR